MGVRKFSSTKIIALVALCLLPAVVPAHLVYADLPTTRSTTQPTVGDYWLLHLPGIAGTCRLERDMVKGLRDGGYDAPIQIYDWTCNDPGFGALLARQRNDKEAQKIADLITAQYRAHPKTRILLTGHSGGCGLAIWAMEKLPADVKIETLLLLAPALSPTYDLSPALNHLVGKVFAFTSPNDAIVLGAGTSVFGTIDGKKVPAAGRVGFSKPDMPVDAKQYEKLVSRPYEDDWMKYGNIGDHMGVMNDHFVRVILTPTILPHLIARAATTRPSEATSNSAAQ